MKKKFKNKINYLILILITGIVLYFSLKDNFEVTINEIKNINYAWFLLAVLFIVIYWLFRTLSIHEFVISFKKDFKFFHSFKMMMTTIFFDGVTPFSSGGQPLQVYYLKNHGVPMVNGTNIAIQNFIVYQIALVLLGVIAIISNSVFNIFPSDSILKKLVTLGFIINLLVTLGLFSVAFLKKFNKFICKLIINILSKLKIIKDKEKKTEEFNKYVLEFNLGAKELVKNKKLFLKGILYNIAALFSYYAIPLIILFAMGDFTSVNLFLTIITSAYVMLIGSFVPIPGGSGGLEYGFIAFFGNFVSGGKLTAAMLIWRFITYYLGIIAGAVIMNIKEKRN